MCKELEIMCGVYNDMSFKHNGSKNVYTIVIYIGLKSRNGCLDRESTCTDRQRHSLNVLIVLDQENI